MEIDITERAAKALNAAVKVLIKAGYPDAGDLVRRIVLNSDGEVTAMFDVIFWLDKDRDSRRIVTVELHHLETGWKATSALLMKPWPEMGSVISVWDFDKHGNPKKQ